MSSSANSPKETSRILTGCSPAQESLWTVPLDM